MKNEIKIPSMGESISEVVIGTLLVRSGDSVKRDQPILELETDKVNQELFAPQAGVVTLSVKQGDIVKVGQVIGFIDGEALPEKAKESEPKQQVVTKPPEGSSIRYTKENFIHDLQNPNMAKEEIKKPVVKGNETRQKMSNIRKVIAKRLVEAQHQTAMLTTFNEIDLTQVIELREKNKENFLKKFGVKLGFMSFFVEAVVSALKEFPLLNSYIDQDDIVHREYYDIGIAVGTDRGLVVPVLRHCDQLTFADIEKEIESFAKKAREGKLAVDDLQGGGFTITNGGVYGSLLSTPILNPPQSGILGMHKIQKRAVVIDDQIVIRSMMYVALSYDHRLVDGKEAVSFLVQIKNLLEDPSRILLHL